MARWWHFVNVRRHRIFAFAALFLVIYITASYFKKAHGSVSNKEKLRTDTGSMSRERMKFFPPIYHSTTKSDVLPKVCVDDLDSVHTEFLWKFLEEPKTVDIHQMSEKYSVINNNQVTLVTSYFNIGSFEKGVKTFFTPKDYHRWMRIFQWIQNPVVVYVETDADVQQFLGLRSSFPINRTRILKVSRKQLWAFRDLQDRVTNIFNSPGYPHFHPNTVIPPYSCIMHAKYELMYHSVVCNYFKTRYFAWLDLGLFRDIVQKQGTNFYLVLPPNFDESRVAYAEVVPRNHDSTVHEIFWQNQVWVCGCYFVAHASVMLRWTLEYKKFTENFIMEEMINTDQQVLYAMFQSDLKPQVHIQTYHFKAKRGIWVQGGSVITQSLGALTTTWFYLAYLSVAGGSRLDVLGDDGLVRKAGLQQNREVISPLGIFSQTVSMNV